MAAFTTFRFSPETGEAHILKESDDPRIFNQNTHQACNRCHDKKLRCSGNKDGCDRCAASGFHCEYSRPGSRNSRKSRQPERYPCSSRTAEAKSSPKNSSSAQAPRPSRRVNGQTSRGNCGPSFSSAADVKGSGGSPYSIAGKSKSGQAVYGMDVPAALAPSTHSSYHAFAPIADYASHSQDFSQHWMVPGATASASMSCPYMLSSGQAYGHDGSVYVDFANHPAYDAYHNDPRLWDLSHQ
ncbi:uncharacterized protein UV8b_05602 [Ustilaginoidea virens]|uniref:Zn(2)-C6 fungal-type domain-containing protein n=1 Tax=Ustilaginoidea virens TaxID=1159556 RepID=A0A8E5HU92_USTVR|nr:uncharacterized protein UV8b_05602 [Ustilaginoidea virens]QUC21359.1 hypothetical protein UV8b_05602 [Ustilaginoidea virens]